LESLLAVWTGTRVGKAKTMTAQTFCKIHILSVFLAAVPNFILIALYEFFQDWRTVKGRASVQFEHAAHH